MGLFDFLDAQRRLRKTALESKDRSKRLKALEKLDDQETLARMALRDEDDTIRSEAIKRLNDLRALVEIALCNAKESERQAAVKRYCQVGKAEEFLPEALKLSGGRERVARVAGSVEWVWPLEVLLKGTEDAELVRQIMPPMPESTRNDIYLRNRLNVRQICEGRLREIEHLQAVEQMKQEAVTDEARAAIVRDESKSTGLRQAAVREITDDGLLSDIAREPLPEPIIEVALERIRDGELLAEAAVHCAHPSLVRRIYPMLMERCARYTPEFVAQDPIADMKNRQEALRRVDDPDVLYALAMEKGDVEFREKAVLFLADRDRLIRIADECDDLRVRWCAAWRAGDDQRAKRIEGLAEKQVNGHAIIVLDAQECYYEARCIRCGQKYSFESDRDSGMNHERGKKYEDFPCRPNFPRM